MKVVPPKRVSRSYTQSLLAPPEAVFPLLCPVREVDWIADWDPLLVVSTSGVAEDDCVFVTPSEPADTIWYVTDYEPKKGFIAFVRVTPGLTATRLSIRLAKVPGGSTARITYTQTSLGADGDAVVDGFTEAAFTDFMQIWEKRINHYLTTGACLAA
jgi:hypothetical protein